jgi:hypothetical protein
MKLYVKSWSFSKPDIEIASLEKKIKVFLGARDLEGDYGKVTKAIETMYSLNMSY